MYVGIHYDLMNERLLRPGLTILEGKYYDSHFSGEEIGPERFCHLHKDTQLERVALN